MQNRQILLSDSTNFVKKTTDRRLHSTLNISFNVKQNFLNEYRCKSCKN
jgi:hypothetical protein